LSKLQAAYDAEMASFFDLLRRISVAEKQGADAASLELKLAVVQRDRRAIGDEISLKLQEIRDVDGPTLEEEYAAHLANAAEKTKTKTKSMDWLAQRTAEAAQRLASKGSVQQLVETGEFDDPDAVEKSVLAPVRHPQRDFYIADLLDIAPKDDMASMEHPLFALKTGDKRVREYRRGGVSVKVMPGTYGCATIHDKDVWIYCISQLIEGINRGREDVSRTVRFTAYDFLVTTNRPTSGGKDGGYQRMAEALARLAGTRIETNIETAEIREREGFGLVDSWRVVEKKGGRMVAVEVTLPDWLFRSVQAQQVLTLSPDYFRIRKPLDRRIYELARKHCGNQKQWQCSVVALHEKSGSMDTVRKLRAALKVLAKADQLPDYSVTVEEAHDVVIFKKR
jgi:hypothetical protein